MPSVPESYEGWSEEPAAAPEPAAPAPALGVLDSDTGMELAEPGENEAAFGLDASGETVAAPFAGWTEEAVDTTGWTEEPAGPEPTPWNERVDEVLRASSYGNPEAAAEAMRLSREHLIPVDVVAKNLAKVKQALEESDPFDYVKDSAGLTFLALRYPERSAKLIKVDPSLRFLADGVQKVMDGFDWLGERIPEAYPGAREEAKGKRQAIRERVEPKARTEVETPEAKAIREGPATALTIPFQRFKERRAGDEVSLLAADLLDARNRGANTERLESLLAQKRRENMPLYLGGGAGIEVLSSAAELGSSMLGMAEDAGPLAALGFAVVGTGILALTKDPAKAMQAGGQAAKVLGAAAAYTGTARREAGSFYLQALEVMPEPEARGFAMMYGVLSSGIEFGAGLTPQALRALRILKANPKALLDNPETRSMARRVLLEHLKGSAGEAGEEVAQGTLSDLLTYAGRWLGTGQRPTGPFVDVGARVQEFTTVLPGALLGGAPSAALAARADVRAEADAAAAKFAKQRAAEQAWWSSELFTVLAQTDSPGARAVPTEIAEMVREQTQKTGKPVDAAHVDAGAFLRLFQSEKQAHDAAVELIGEDGPKLLQEAAASGGMLEVPMARYLEKWGGTETAQALVDDTTVSPEVPTRNQQKAAAKEVQLQVAALDQELEGKAEPTSRVAAELVEMERTLVEALGFTPADARASLAPWHAVARTAVARFAQGGSQATLDELFAGHTFRVGADEEGEARLELVSDAAEPEGEVDTGFEFGGAAEGEMAPLEVGVTAAPPVSEAALKTVTALVGRMRDKGKKEMARGWLAFVSGQGERVEVSPEIEKLFASHGLVDPERGFTFDEGGRSLEGRRTPGARSGGQAALPEQFRRSRLSAYGTGQRYEQVAYHGSPHRGIEVFSLNKIGTGEGHQVYAWGMYFGEAQATGEYYREALTKQTKYLGAMRHQLNDVARSVVGDAEMAMREGKTAEQAVQHAREYRAKELANIEKGLHEAKARGLAAPSQIAARERWVADARAHLEFAEKMDARFLKYAEPGQLYQAEVPEKEELLDYDAKLGAQPAILEKVRPLWARARVELTGGDIEARGVDPEAYTGAQLYDLLVGSEGSPKAASEALRSVGVPGLRYLDQHSRGSSYGTSNFVIWDESRMPITKTYYQQDQAQRSVLLPGEQPGPVWHSAVAKAVEGAKQGKGDAKSWLAVISKTPGVKQEEVDALGLRQALELLQAQQKGALTREQVVAAVNAKFVELPPTEKVLGASLKEAAAKFEEARVAADRARDALEEELSDLGSEHPSMLAAVLRDGQRPEGTWSEKEREIANAPSVQPLAEAAKLSSDAVEKASAAFGVAEEAKTHYGPGGRWAAHGETPGSYRELLMYIPGGEEYVDKQAHFGGRFGPGKGLSLHVRFSEHALADGTKVLLIDEIQSFAHQQGRDEGYAEEGAKRRAQEATQRWMEAEEALTAHLVGHGFSVPSAHDVLDMARNGEDPSHYPGRFTHTAQELLRHDRTRHLMAAVYAGFRDHRAAVRGGMGGVPNITHKETWEALALKRMVRWAAENGYERIAWTTGEAQAKRYNLAQDVSLIAFDPEVRALTILGLKGEEIRNERDVTNERLAEVIGKDYAKTLLASERKDGGPHVLEGEGLTLGGEGMKAAYDRRIPKEVEKLVKKHGGKVQREQLSLPNVYEDAHGNWLVRSADGEELAYPTEEQAREAAGDAPASEQTEVWTATLPEALRAQVLKEGLPLFQEKGGGQGVIRGASDFDPAGKLRQMILTRDANLSTYLHESGHVFLHLLRDMAAREDAPPSVREDFDAVLKWFGVGRWEDVTREHHEQWARSFERYLMEGKAPSAALRRVFRRFLLWLKDIYKQVEFLNAPLNDEIRQVFDRLLATDQEIARAKKAMGGIATVFNSAEEMGLSGEEWQKHLTEQEESTGRAQRQAELTALKDVLRETEAWWKDEDKKLVQAAGAEYEQHPATQAKEWLKLAGIPLEMPLAQAPNLDDVADALGFPTGQAMLEAVRAHPEKAAWAKQRAAEQMAERHPSVLEERDALRAEVAKGLHGDFTAQWLLKEWAALRKKAGVKGEPPVAAIERAAKQMVERRAVAKLPVGNVLASERSAAEKCAKSAAAGNYAQAHVFMQQRLLNLYLHRAMSEARELRDTFLERAQDADADTARARLGKAGPIYRDGVDLLLETLGLSEERRRETPLPSLAEVVSALEGDGATVLFDPAAVARALARRDFGAVTVAELREVDAALKNIQGAARTRATVLIDGKRQDKAETVAQLVARAQEMLEAKGAIPSSKSAASLLQRAAQAGNALDGSLTAIEEMARMLDGDDIFGPWFRAVIKPMQDAKAREQDLGKATAEPIFKAWEAMPKDVEARLGESIDGRALFPDHHVALGQALEPPTKRFELLMLALNAGNESNLQRLLEGRNITPDQLAAAINLLTKEEVDWVQSVWDAHESLWPLAADLEERLSGLRPPKLELKPLVTRHGTYRGGYFPAIYDRRVAAVGEKQVAGQVAALMDPTFTRPGTSHNHLKSRAQNFAAAIDLDPGSIPAHLAQVVHDIAFREAVQSVGALVLDPAVQATLKDRLGDGMARQFLQWVKDVGQMRGSEGMVHAGVLLKMMRAVKGNIVISALGYALPNMVEDLSNLPRALTATDLKARHLGAAMSQFLASPLETANWAHEKSGELRTRRGNFARDLAEQTTKMTGGVLARSPMAAVKKHAFAPMEFTDWATSTMVWVGAYRQAAEQGLAEADAVTKADVIVRQLFPSHSPVDTAAILRDKGYIGTILTFYGFLSRYYNNLRALGHKFNQAEGWSKAQYGAALVGTVIATGVLSEWLRGRGREPDEEWLEWFLRKSLTSPLTALPFGGDVANAIEGWVLGKQTNPRTTSLVGVAVALGEAVARPRKDTAKQVEAILRAVGPLTGVTISQPLRTGKFLWQMAEGELQPPEDWSVVPWAISGAIYGDKGEKQPATPLRPAGLENPLSR